MSFSASSSRVSADEAAQVAGILADMTAAGLPLSAALHAAAEQAGGAMGRTLEALAQDMDRGTSLEAALAGQEKNLPPYLRGLLAAAIATGDVGATLLELVEHGRLRRELWSTIVVSLAYPAIVFAIALGVFLFLNQFVFHELTSAYADFQLSIRPWRSDPVKIQETVSLVAHSAVWLLLFAVIAGAIALAVARLIFGRSGPAALMAHVPLIGVLWKWSAAADASRLLALLIDRGIPLSKSLRLLAEAVPDAALTRLCRRLATKVDEGISFAAALAGERAWPASLTPLVHWGERTGELADALRAGAEMFDSRARLRAAVLRTLLPPMLLIMVGLLTSLMVAAIMQPMLSILQALS